MKGYLFFGLLFLIMLPVSAQKGFGISALCNVNAICEPDWCNQRRSVALIYKYENGTYSRWATGSLIVNERMDGKPYFYTANHVIDWDKNGSISAAEQENIDNFKVVFNYQASDCSPNTPLLEPDTTQYVIIGAKLVTHNYFNGDYALLELNERPPSNFNTYYNGWSNSSNTPKSGAIIHHPKGDIKKNTTFGKEIKKTFGPWLEVTDKDIQGTTQPGSSGAPWFNEDKLIIGVQSQGSSSTAACDDKHNNTAGQFSKNWKDGLDIILNPNGDHTGLNQSYIVAMSGMETCKMSWSFSDANDLHTSDNISFVNGINTLGTRMYDGHYNAKSHITAGNNVSILPNTTVVFEAGYEIILSDGFHAESGSNFTAKIGNCEKGCNNGKSTNDNFYISIKDTTYDNFIENKQFEVLQENISELDLEDLINSISIFPNPSSTGIFEISNSTPIKSIEVFSILGESVRTVFVNSASYQLDLSKYAKTVYFLKINTNQGSEMRKILVK